MVIRLESWMRGSQFTLNRMAKPLRKFCAESSSEFARSSHGGCGLPGGHAAAIGQIMADVQMQRQFDSHVVVSGQCDEK